MMMTMKMKVWLRTRTSKRRESEGKSCGVAAFLHECMYESLPGREVVRQIRHDGDHDGNENNTQWSA